MYAVVDIETTGSFSKNDGITEIGAIITDGSKILDEYQTLINPGHSIPDFIVSLTGITNEMLVDAPYFEEIQKDLFNFLEGQIFVAHNVQFDYNFIRNSFEKQGVEYNSKRLCTVRLARKLIPEAVGYSLGKITKFFGIENDSPHRAMGDARATVNLFHELVKRDENGVIDSYLKSNSHETILPLNVRKDDFVNLPHRPGVYFFLDEKGKIIYIGKAKNLKKRVSSHFSGSPDNRRRHHFHTEIYKIDFELAGSEMLAALREDQLIRKHWPKYNKAQKKRVTHFGIFEYKDQSNVTRLGIQKCSSNSRPIEKFHSEWQAKDHLTHLVKEYNLMPEKCGLPAFWNVKSNSKKHEIGIEKIKKEKHELESTFAFIEEGRDRNEKCIVVVENNALKGFGYISIDEQIVNREQIEDFIQFGSNSTTANGIVSLFLERNNPKLISL